MSKIFIREEEDKFILMGHGIDHDVNNNSNHDEQQKHKQHSQHHQQQDHQQLPISNHYNVNLQYDSITPEAGRQTKLILSVTEQKSGDPIREFELLHDKLMHLIIVGQDLSYFAHIHPTWKTTARALP